MSPTIQEVVDAINVNKFTTRKQVYTYFDVGHKKSKKHIHVYNILQSNGLLMKAYTKEEVDAYIIEVYRQGLPTTATAHNCMRASSRKYYKTWNDYLKENGIPLNQNRYSITQEQAIQLVVGFYQNESAVPTRDDFNGSNIHRPYYESILSAMDVDNWGKVLEMVGLSHKKHGRGYTSIEDGVTYLSDREKEIGRLCKRYGFTFDKETPYGNGNNFRFDFYIKEINMYIEYYGLDTPEYMERVATKRRFYANRFVLEIFKGEDIQHKLKSMLMFKINERLFKDDRDAMLDY